MTTHGFSEHMEDGFDIAMAMSRGTASAEDGVRLSEALRGMAEEYALLNGKYSALLAEEARRLQHAIALNEDRLPLRWDCCLDLEIGN